MHPVVFPAQLPSTRYDVRGLLPLLVINAGNAFHPNETVNLSENVTIKFVTVPLGLSTSVTVLVNSDIGDCV